MRACWKIIASSLTLTTISVTSMAQTKTPNPGTASILRTWPITGIWQTALARREDRTLGCMMFSGHKESGQVQYLAGIRHLPAEFSIVISDRDKGAVSGNHIHLVVDNVEIGNFDITKHVDDNSGFHSISALVPETETQRVINLFRTGADVKFLTDDTTFDFPLMGAAASIENMRQCILEAANLSPGLKSPKP